MMTFAQSLLGKTVKYLPSHGTATSIDRDGVFGIVVAVVPRHQPTPGNNLEMIVTLLIAPRGGGYFVMRDATDCAWEVEPPKATPDLLPGCFIVGHATDCDCGGAGGSR